MADDWWKQEKKSARKLRAMAVVSYALARGHIDQARYAELAQLVPRTPHVDVPALVADLPVPRWDRVPVTEPVDDLQREFAVALLDVGYQAEVLSGPDRRWRTVFAVNARTAADLLVLFLDTDPYLRHRRKDPAMVTRLARLEFVPEVLVARGRGRLSRAEFEHFLTRAAGGESLDTLRAELGGPVQAEAPPSGRLVERESGGATEEGSFNWLGESPVVGSYDRSSEEDSFDWLGTAPEPAAAEPVTPEPAEPVVTQPVVTQPVATEPPATDLDRARIAKYLEQALVEGRLEPGEHAARTLALWSATTTRELARLVVDLPVPADEPLRDRKVDHRADDLITPADRQGVLDQLNHAMAGHRLTLWEYETRLDVALNARTYGELWPAVAGLR